MFGTYKHAELWPAETLSVVVRDTLDIIILKALGSTRLCLAYIRVCMDLTLSLTQRVAQ